MFFCKNAFSQKSVQNYEKNSKYARKIAAFSALGRKLCGKSYFFGEKVTSHPWISVNRHALSPWLQRFEAAASAAQLIDTWGGWLPPTSEYASLYGACAERGFSDWGRPYFSSSLPDFFCNFMLWCIPIWFSGSADCAHYARQKRAPSAKSAAKLQNKCPITLDWFWKNAKKISFSPKIVHFGPNSYPNPE